MDFSVGVCNRRNCVVRRPALCVGVQPSGIHLTLKFLGSTDARLVPDILTGLDRSLQGAQAPELSLSGLGMFPNSRNPRVLWAGVSGDLDTLEDWYERVESLMVGLGWGGGAATIPAAPYAGSSKRPGISGRPRADCHRDVPLLRSRAGAMARQCGAALPKRTDAAGARFTPTWVRLRSDGNHIDEGSSRRFAPYDFELTAGQPNYSREQEFKTEEYVDGAYLRLLDLGDKAALATVESTGSVDDPELTVALTGDGLTDDDAERAGQADFMVAGMRPGPAAILRFRGGRSHPGRRGRAVLRVPQHQDSFGIRGAGAGDHGSANRDGGWRASCATC